MITANITINIIIVSIITIIRWQLLLRMCYCIVVCINCYHHYHYYYYYYYHYHYYHYYSVASPSPVAVTLMPAVSPTPSAWGISRARILILVCAFFVEVLRRIVETDIFPCEMTNTYCGDLRRRRIRARSAQKRTKVLAREIPYLRLRLGGGLGLGLDRALLRRSGGGLGRALLRRLGRGLVQAPNIE